MHCFFDAGRCAMRRGTAWLLLCAFAGLPGVGQSQVEQRQVLVLLETTGTVAAELLSESLTTGLHRDPAEVDLYIERLDANRFAAAEQDVIFADFLRRKYANVALDLMVAVGPASLEFAERYRDSLFAGVPVIFSGVSEASLPLDELPPGVTGIVSHFDIAGTLKLALALQPEATHIVVVSGAGPFDRKWHASARERLADYEGSLEVRYLTGLPMESLLSELGKVPADAIVLLTTVLEDGTGRRLSPTMQTVERVSAASSAPVYGPYETWIGHGIVGGYVDPFRVLGARTADLAREVLRGERPADAPIRESPSEYVVDWRQLERWNLDESRLPPGARVRFREPSLWSEHRWAVVITLVVVLLQTVTIGALMFEHDRRRKVEAERREGELRFLAQLAHLNRVAGMGEFSASMAHELMQPLSAILNNADAAGLLLEKEPPDVGQVREIIDDIRADDSRAAEIIQSMRRFSKRHEVVMRTVELKPLVDEVMRFARTLALDREVTLTFKPDAGLPPVAADRVHLEQVLMNLILNAMDAIDAVPDGSRTILVAARWAGTGPVTVSVSDTGSGIPSDQLETIFKPFYTTKKDGIGMGLAIIRTIIEAHRGRIWAENNPAGGATFHFTLSVGEAPAGASSGVRSPATSSAAAADMRES